MGFAMLLDNLNNFAMDRCLMNILLCGDIKQRLG